jgi:DNA-binding NarL/FixJ family response regulator
VPEPTIRVVLVDDHPLLRDGTRAILEQVDGLRIVGTAADGAATLAEMAAHQPDVLVLDLGLPDVSGVDLVQRVRSGWPDVAVVVLTGYSVAPHAQALTQLGVHRILHKSVPSAELVQAIRHAAGGRPASAGPVDATSAAPVEPLTVREHEVLGLIAAGYRNAEIATELHVSLNTVEFHVRNLLGKLGVRSRTEAVTRARALGYALPDDLPTC